ncbi:MAG: hypothetical protein IJ150_10990 [Bacteroidales bacterium]|nr:hypothetical protein [Bacteroidales bacterium]
MNKISNLVIGQGIGPIKFLMTEDEVISIIGQPDSRECETEDGEQILTLFYDKIETDFVFEKTLEGKFALSSLLCTSEDFTLDNKINCGVSKEDFLKYTKSLKASDPEIEKDEKSNEEFLFFEDLGLLAIFTSEKLSGIQIEYWDEQEDE